MRTSDGDTIVAMLKNPLQREAGFRKLMSEYGDRLYWHVRRIVVGHDDAEDVMQETAINIYKYASTFKGECSLTTWIYKIATNESLKWLKKHGGTSGSADFDSAVLADKIAVENDLDENSAVVLFQKAVLTLPAQQRIAFNMRYYDELSYEEISKITGKSVSTLKTNYHFAVEKISNYLKENSI